MYAIDTLCYPVFTSARPNRPIMCRGGDLGGLGTVPQNLRWGKAHALVPPQYLLREIVLSDARESVNRVKKGVSLVRKGSNMTFNIAKIGKIWEKQEKI